MNLLNLIPGVKNFLQRYETDLFWIPSAYPANAMEVLGTTALRWAGASGGLSLDSGNQILKSEYMSQDEYDEFIINPSEFIMQKVFPKKHSKLSGLSKITFSNNVELGHFGSMAAFADPEVRSTLLTLMYAGEESVKWQNAIQEICEVAIEMQAPLGTVMGQSAPYDMLADNLRGFIQVPMDLFEVPEKVLAAIAFFTKLALAGVADIKTKGFKYVFMPLHGGTDSFMSNDTYRKYYWPSLKLVIDEIIKLDMTPYIFCEGSYNTRFDVLKEVSPKKCIYMFEQVDIVKAKKELGDVACITGTMPGYLLVYGKKQKVIDETKKMLDQCAPGGGFIMDCSVVLENYNEENLDAWFETTFEYGKY